MNKYSTRNKQGVHEYHSDYYYNDHTYLYRGKEGCTIVPVFGGPPVSVCCITPLLCTVLYCAVQRVMAVAWEGACKQSSNITAVSSSQCYHHHRQP